MATISNNEIKIKYSLDTTDLANATQLFDRLSAEDRQLLNDLKKLQAQLTATGQAGQGAGTNISRGNKAASGSLTDLQNRVKDLTNRLNNLNPTASNYETILKRLQRAQANLNIATAQTNDRLNKSEKQFRALDSTIGGLGKTIIAVFSVQQFLSFGKSVLDTTIKMEGLSKAIEFTSKSAIGGRSNFEFLKKTAEEFGIPLVAAAEGFRSLSAAAGRANIGIMEQREMFTDLSKAMSALSLTSQDASLIFFGFGQLLSKSKVSAQELYHQIGERLPIAMEAAQIAAAKITGKLKVTSAELIELVESGKLLSSEFAPEFTKALGEIAKSGAYVNTLGKDTERLSNAWEEFKKTIGDSAVLGGFIRFLTSAAEKLDDLGGAMNYLVEHGFFQERTYNEFKKFQKDVVNTYDLTLIIGKKKFKDLDDLNARHQETMSDQTKDGELLRSMYEAEFNTRRKKAVEDLKNSILREEKIIADSKKELTKVSTEDAILGLSREQKARKNQLEYNIALAESAKAAFESLYGTIPTLTKPIPDPKEEEKARKAREKALEDAYRKELARLESQRKAKEDIIKSEMNDGTLRDIELAKNNEYWAKQMFSVDVKYAKMNVELAKNNRIERAAEIRMLAALQEQLVEEANQKALDMEKDYHDKAMETLQDQQRKRKQSMQTDEENELAADKDFFDDKIKILTDKYKEAISIEAISLETSKKLTENYQKDLLSLQEGFRQSQADIDAKYRQKEKEDTIRSQHEVRSILVQAATIRASALEKDQIKKLDIEKEGALTEIEIQKSSIREQIRLNQENTTLSLKERENRNNELLAQMTLLGAKEIQITEETELEKANIRIQKMQEALGIVSNVMSQFGQLYQDNLNREKEALNIRYNEEVRLAGDNKQKLAQLAQEKAKAEYEIELKQFKMRRDLAIADVVMKTAPIIAQQLAGIITAPLALLSYAAQAAQIGIIMSQQPPVPPYKDGTKGRPHPGGPALVGEAGVERVVTTDGKIYYTPPMATLIDLPKGSQVIPNHALSSRELFWANAMNDGKPISISGGIERKLDKIGGILEALPVHQINMNEKGFEKFVRTPRRTTKILNNQFPLKH